MQKFHQLLDKTGLPAPAGGLAILATALTLAALLVNLGLQPLFLEEPRRTMVAMEMWANHNLIVPLQLGEYYYKKPPFFNWVLLAVVQITGNYGEFWLRLPTVLSTLGISVLTWWAGRRYVNVELGWLAALLFLCAGGILFYFSMLAEIDLFYSFITFTGLLAIFHFYQQQQWWWLFVGAYTLAAIGTLTKGLPSIIFVGVSLLAYFGYEKKWRRLFSLQHLYGILLYLVLVGSYLLAYASYHDLGPFLAEQMGETSERTVADQGILSLLEHLFTFPLDTIKDLLPGGLLLVFLVRKDLFALLRSNPFIAFSALVFAANFIPYWISPGARQRYIYMLYPFLSLVLGYAYQHRHELAAWREKVWQGLVGVFLFALPAGSLALPFIPDFQFLTYRYELAFGFALVSGILLHSFLRRRQQAVYWLILATLIARLLFDLTVLPQRAHHSGAQEDKELAKKIHEVVGEEEVYLYCFQRMSFTTVIYLNQWRRETLVRNSDKNTRDFFIFDATAYDDPREVFLTFEYWGRQYELVKFK